MVFDWCCVLAYIGVSVICLCPAEQGLMSAASTQPHIVIPNCSSSIPTRVAQQNLAATHMSRSHLLRSLSLGAYFAAVMADRPLRGGLLHHGWRKWMRMLTSRHFSLRPAQCPSLTASSSFTQAHGQYQQVRERVIAFEKCWCISTSRR